MGQNVRALYILQLCLLHIIRKDFLHLASMDMMYRIWQTIRYLLMWRKKYCVGQMLHKPLLRCVARAIFH